MAVYRVTNVATGAKRLIETRTKSGAINHVAGGDYKAEALNTRELVKDIQSGITVETLTKEEEAAVSSDTAAVTDAATKPAPAATKALLKGAGTTDKTSTK